MCTGISSFLTVTPIKVKMHRGEVWMLSHEKKNSVLKLSEALRKETGQIQACAMDLDFESSELDSRKNMGISSLDLALNMI